MDDGGVFDESKLSSSSFSVLRSIDSTPSSSLLSPKDDAPSASLDSLHIAPALTTLYVNEPYTINISVVDSRGKPRPAEKKSVKIRTFYADTGEKVKGVVTPATVDLDGKEEQEVKITCLQPSFEHKNRQFFLRFSAPGLNPVRSDNFSVDVKVKIVLIGNGQVGKSSLLSTFLGKDIHERDQVLEMYSCRWKTESDDDIALQIWDRADKSDAVQRIEEMIYPNTDVFLVCFALNDRKSFESVSKWTAGIRAEVSSPVIIGLIGTKADRVKSASADAIITSEGQQKAKEIKANFYLECASSDKSSCNAVFKEAVLAACPMKFPPKPRRATCRQSCEGCSVS